MLEEKGRMLDDMWSHPGADIDHNSASNNKALVYRQIQDLVDNLEVPAAIIEIFPPVTTPDIIILIVRSGEKTPSFLKLATSENQLENLFKTYYREVVQYARHGDIGQRWQDLAAPLLTELLPHLQGVELVYLIPHGMLCYLPLHAFPMDGSCFIDRFAIAYAPSSSLLKEVVERSAARKTQSPLKALVVGNPTFDLIQTEQEARQVAQFFGATPYLGSKATRVKIKSELPGKDLIHLACHGLFHSSEPWLSTILLAGKRGLQVADIEAVNLQADLVTLSACESGLHDVYSKSEPVGLPEVFLRAGASSVLGTMWAVGDESTRELMIHFYSRLYNVTGHKVYTKAKALQEAVLKMRKKKAHPFYWAPFVLHGHWQ
jgi:CHAT domain-containing protein